MLTLYEYPPSGNSYKCHLLIHLLGLPHENVVLDILQGATRTPEFLAMNPNGRIPVLKLDDGRTLAESSAILSWLADGTAYLPDDRYARAKVQEWMCFEQYNLEPNIAVARFWVHSKGQTADELGAPLAEKMEKGYEALDVLEDGLRDRQWLVADSPTIADICLYGYTHVAADGGFDLEPYGEIRQWIERVEALPGYIPMENWN